MGERLFLFCFRSCLKGENDTEFYDVLEIDNPNIATTDTIKKQYKKLSLANHPDKLAQRGITITAEHKQKFVKIKEAYDILSDPKRRRRYDQLGLSGLKLLENPTEVDPTAILRNYQRNRGDRTLIVLLIALVFAAVLILPILFSLKADETLNDGAKWTAIWTPMWVVDLFLILFSVALFLEKDTPPETNDEGEEIPVEKTPLSDKIYNFLGSVAFVLLQVFIMMRMDKDIHWSWFAVFAPWFVYEAVSIVSSSGLAYFTTFTKPDHESMGLMEEGRDSEEAFMIKIEIESKYFEKIMEQTDARKSINVSLLRVWLAIFLALQLDGSVNWNWGLVLLPVWVYLFMQYVYAMVFRCWGSGKLAGIDEETMEAMQRGEEKDPIKIVNAQQGSQLMANSTFLCFAQAAPLFIAILLVSRLESTYITTFVIILPVFIAIGCCCCLAFCGICWCACVDLDKMEEELGKGREGGAGAGGEANESQAEGDSSAADKGKGTYTPPVVIVPPSPDSSSTSPFVIPPALAPTNPVKPLSTTAAPEHIDLDID